ncbi:hypothetical protein A0H81_13490 [Grifola frondosa]|uniref:Uncharacterized protein n=1 Tax=Grifola frondosa TaxID=5627 RepID=A0A1C7LPE2_GRIFR|nr:hypothetical protein A0H81_13490 [Grifola frondosa]
MPHDDPHCDGVGVGVDNGQPASKDDPFAPQKKPFTPSSHLDYILPLPSPQFNIGGFEEQTC